MWKFLSTKSEFAWTEIFPGPPEEEGGGRLPAFWGGDARRSYKRFQPGMAQVDFKPSEVPYKNVHADNLSINLMKLKKTTLNTFHTGRLFVKALSLNLWAWIYCHFCMILSKP